MSRWPDLTGERFGHLSVERRALVSETPKDKYKLDFCRWWMTKCDCGKLVVVNTKRLNNGVASCGCFSGRTKSFGEAAKQSLYRWYAAGAKRRKKIFDLTFEQFVSITSRPCNYCGAEPRSTWVHHKRKDGSPKYHGGYLHNGVDRVDSSKGYSANNCVPCCKACNYAKNDKSVAEFKAWVQAVYTNLFPKEGFSAIS